MNNTQKLSVLFVTNNYSPYSGGVVNSIRSHAHELRKQGHRVTIVTLDFLDRYTDREDDVVRLFCPLKFEMNTNHMAVPWQAQQQITSLIKTLNPCIVHVHHPFLLGKAASRVAQRLKIPVVFTYHTLYEHYAHYVPFIPTKLTQQIVKHMVHTFCKKIDGIIAPSSIVQEQLFKADIKTPIARIASSIAEDFFLPLPLLSKKINQPFHVITVSRFAKEKNIPFLIDVVAELDPTAFVATFIGYGPEKKRLEKYAFSHKKIPPHMITFVEKPSKELLMRSYYNADLFIFASQSETQGLVLAEAMSQGTPVIALQGPGQRDLIEHGKNGYLIYNQQEMQNAVELLQQNPFLIERLQKNAFETAQQFTPEKVTSSLVHFYHDIINQHSLSNKRPC